MFHNTNKIIRHYGYVKNASTTHAQNSVRVTNKVYSNNLQNFTNNVYYKNLKSDLNIDALLQRSAPKISITLTHWSIYPL